MGINAVIRCSECDKVWRKAEMTDGKCPLCHKIERLKEGINDWVEAGFIAKGDADYVMECK